MISVSLIAPDEQGHDESWLQPAKGNLPYGVLGGVDGLGDLVEGLADAGVVAAHDDVLWKVLKHCVLLGPKGVGKKSRRCNVVRG